MAAEIRRASLDLTTLPSLARCGTGALDACQHAVLRLLLWRRNTMPLGLPRLLDYGARLVLLQRAGGGYRFVHGSPMEHIAGRPDGAA